MFAILLVALPNFYWLTNGKPLDLLHPPVDTRFWVLAAVGFAGYELLAAALMVRQRAIAQWSRARSARTISTTALARWPMLVVTCGAGMAAGVCRLPGPDRARRVCGACACCCCGRWCCSKRAIPCSALGRCFSLARPMWIKVLASCRDRRAGLLVCAIAAAACLGILRIAADPGRGAGRRP